MLFSYALRTALTLGKTAFAPPCDLMDEVEVPFFAWPTDIDFNGHVNNGRFLTLMDQGRLAHAARTGVLRASVKTGCNAVAAKASIQFRRELRPFKPSTLVTRVRGWDEKRLYFAQRILRNGQVHAEAEVALALRLKGRTISARDFLELAGIPVSDAFLRARLDAPSADSARK